MDPETQRTLITTIGAVVLGLIGLVNVLWTRAVAAKQASMEKTVVKKADESIAASKVNTKKIDSNSGKIDGNIAAVGEYHKEVNGKMDAFLEVKEQLGNALGYIEGLQNGKTPGSNEEDCDETVQTELVDGHEPKDVKDR